MQYFSFALDTARKWRGYTIYESKPNLAFQFLHKVIDFYSLAWSRLRLLHAKFAFKCSQDTTRSFDSCLLRSFFGILPQDSCFEISWNDYEKFWVNESLHESDISVLQKHILSYLCFILRHLMNSKIGKRHIEWHPYRSKEKGVEYSTAKGNLLWSLSFWNIWLESKIF